MATYNFTVRATDNLGAYADREFSLDVNNTDISRFVVVGSTGLAHSTTGATWTTEAGLSGTGVTFGGGKWVVWTGLTSNVIRTSGDAISWTTANTVFTGKPNDIFHTQTEATAGGLGAIQPSIGFSMIKWIGDKFVGMTRGIKNSSGSAAYIGVEYHSVDAINWTFQRVVNDQVAVSATPSVGGVLDFEYDSTTDTWVAVVQNTLNASTIKYRVGNGDWTSAPVMQSMTTSNCGASIMNVNGLWLVASRLTNVSGQSYPILTSVDGINWTPRAAGASNIITGLAYANGRLLTIAETSTASSYFLRASTDAGRTWNSLTTNPNGSGSSTTVNWSQILAYYAGNLLWVNPNNSSYVRRSTDDGTSTMSTVTLNTIGSLLAVYARQS